MNRQQRSVGFLLIALQAVALGYGFRTWIFSTAVIVAGLIGWLSTLRFASPRTALRWPIVLAILYVVQRAVVPQAWYAGAQSFLYPDSCLTAEYFLVFQVGQFFVRRDGDRLPAYLPVLAMVAMTFTADLQVRGQTRLVFQLFSLGLVFLSAWYFAVCRLPGGAPATRNSASRSVALGAVLLVTGATAWISASNLYSHAHQIERMLFRMANPPSPPESAGFSGQGRLGSIASQKEASGDGVALRVWAGQSPGYLRGRAFDTYARSEWQTSGDRIAVTPEHRELLPPRLGADDDVPTFLLSRSGSEAWHRMEIWPNRQFREVVFSPLRLTALQAPVEKLTIDSHGIPEADELPVGTAYVAWSASSAEPLTTVSPRLTSLPADLDPRIRDLANRVAGQGATDREKIAAVERYFLDNYQYQLGISIPAQVDPLTYFLLEKPPAHCEYFASGAAVLLRAIGVPCRYVTGFVVVERNDYGGYWLAKNRDAHAWVEAFDRQRGWVLVEATPAGGVPQTSSAARASQIWDAIRARWQRLVAAIRQGGLRAVFGAFRELLQRPWLWLALSLFAAAWAVRWLVRRRRRIAVLPRDPLVDELRRLLQRMDARWRKAGLARQPYETLHQFAARLTSVSTAVEHQQAADWYRRFAVLRYRGRADPDAVRGLRQGLPKQSWARIAMTGRVH